MMSEDRQIARRDILRGSVAVGGLAATATLPFWAKLAMAQDEVVVRLRRDVVALAVLPVKVRNYGKIDRPVRVWDEDDVRAYALGRLESQARVEIGFALRGAPRAAAVPWSRILAGIEAPGSNVSVGSPGWTMLLRAWLAIFRVF